MEPSWTNRSSSRLLVVPVYVCVCGCVSILKLLYALLVARVFALYLHFLFIYISFSLFTFYIQLATVPASVCACVCVCVWPPTHACLKLDTTHDVHNVSSLWGQRGRGSQALRQCLSCCHVVSYASLQCDEKNVGKKIVFPPFSLSPLSNAPPSVI